MPKFCRIRCLIENCLQSHIFEEQEAVSLTTEEEKHLLLALSQVSREIKLWIHELDSSDTDEEMGSETLCEETCSDESKLTEIEGSHSMTKILADLIPFLAVESPYLRHLAGNILVAISEFVASCASEWGSYIHSLCICLGLLMASLLACAPPPLMYMNGLDDTFCDSSGFVVLMSKLKNGNWSTAAGIVRVLRNILKYVKEERDDQCLELFLGSITSFISLMNHVGRGRGTLKNNVQISDDLFFESSDEESKVVFLGFLIQFLCSLAEQSSCLKAMAGTKDHDLFLDKIVNLVPKLLSWCVGKQGNRLKISISQYFKHKLLMLMLRLSYQSQLNCSILVSWLQLLHVYFEELLRRPITEFKSARDEYLEGSPFLWSLCDVEAGSICSLHLQRKVVLLFLRCCLTMINSSKQCTCATVDSCLTANSSTDMICCIRKKGLLDLSEWLQEKFPTEKLGVNEMYLENCSGFAQSFLHLYMHEDDMLFKVLLQLLSVPCGEEQLNGVRWTFQDVKRDALSHVSNLFNPVCLFHLFLAELHYDHQVLLDYLISRDTGINCAEYLLRCLRIVCDSWQSFRSFCMVEGVVNQSSSKRRKVTLEGSDFHVEPSSVHRRDQNVPSSLSGKERDFGQNCKQYKTKAQPFEEAKVCLLSLKDSVEKLHEKNLFPYNPEVLLNRLTKFQGLCFNGRNREFT
ncbi:hypothetical protein K2173_021290 [Erythroxylum novogranatense]|uniref:Protein Lines C-terminal domain-containing protein n=1 Tax=Erythroxylum novogranatense TaxID=1862640 RepID=A0AAV8TY70_9ROSI|nr:hypothetical protein K2173_021290 [Erythroxylum novogranatense]